MLKINWLNDINAARKSVVGTKRLILIFFHHLECEGCKKSINITFQDSGVRDLIERDFAPLSFIVTEAQEMTALYKIEWTPTFILADENLRELERLVGYLPPEDFITQLRLAEGMCDIHLNRLRDAENVFSWILDNRPDADVAPQARYYLGLSIYKETGDYEHLVRTWDAMRRRYPGNSWTKRASAWSR